MGKKLGAALKAWTDASEWLAANAKTGLSGVLTAAVPYLHLAVTVCGGWQMSRAALAAASHLGGVIAATAVQIGWVWQRHGKVDTMLWVSLGLVAVFGGATLLLHDETFIKWKPTILYDSMTLWAVRSDPCSVLHKFSART